VLTFRDLEPFRETHEDQIKDVVRFEEDEKRVVFERGLQVRLAAAPVSL
jgi:hypothetical protein